MNKDKLVDAIGLIKDEYIEEAHTKNKFRWSWALTGKVLTAAACLLFIINIIPFNSYKSSDSVNNSYGSYSDESYYSYEYDDEKYALDSSVSSNEINSPLQENRKLILTANLSLETLDLDSVTEALIDNVKKYNGYVQSSSVSTRNSSRYYSATIRIPADKYNEFISNIKQTGNVVSYSENVDDITDSYTDMEARLNSLKAQEAKVLEFYNQATSIEEMMDIESRLSDLRYQIESIEAQLKNYDLLTSYSTLNISITETKVYTPVSENFFTRLGNAFTNGFHNFTEGIGDLLIDIVYNIWFIILIPIIGFIGYKVYKKIRKNK